jgi:Uma2 family endonuclease
MPKTAIKIGPNDHGRRMSLDDFDLAEAEAGYRYELSRGIVNVTGIPNPSHFAMVNAVRRQLSAHDLANPGRIYGIATGSECKILVSGLESERHPDLAVYKTSPPSDNEEAWSNWIPELVVEIVSKDSKSRDYDEKREDYLQFGIQEYWIFDADKKEMLALCRSRGKWTEKTVRPLEVYRTTLLPGLEFKCEDVFKAAGR